MACSTFCHAIVLSLLRSFPPIFRHGDGRLDIPIDELVVIVVMLRFDMLATVPKTVFFERIEAFYASPAGHRITVKMRERVRSAVESYYETPLSDGPEEALRVLNRIR